MNTSLLRLRAFYLSTGLAGGILTPYLSLLLGNNGFSSSEIGIVMAAGTAVAILTQPLWGYFVDRTQKVRFTLALSCLVPGLVAVVFDVRWLWAVVLANLLFNLFSTPQAPISDAFAVSAAKAAGTSYGTIRMFASLGFALGGYAGGLYLASLPMTWLWLPYLVLCFLGTATAVTFPHQHHSVEVSVPVSMRTGLTSLLRNRRFVVFLLGGFLLSQTLTAFNTYFALTYQAMGGSMRSTGIAFFLASATNVPAMLIAAKVMKRLGRERILMLSAGAYIVRWLVQACVPVPAVAIAIQVLHGISFGFYYVVAVDFVSVMADKELQATAQSIFGMVCGGAAGIVGNLLNGFLLRVGGPPVMYGTCTVSAFLGALCFWYVSTLSRRLTRHIQSAEMSSGSSSGIEG